jgi:opacity protein-like surface antigen
LRTPLKILFLLLIVYSTKAQHLTHDVGVFIGPSTIQNDYAKKEGFFDLYAINGLSISLVHYLHFFNVNNRWNSKKGIANHLMVKSEFNFLSKNTFENLGKYTLGTSPEAQKLKAMTGTATISNIAVHGEYYLKDLKDFMFPYSDIKWNPYVSVGFAFSFFTNTLNSTLGDWRNDMTILPEKYRADGEVAIGSDTALSFSLGAGTRYKLSEKYDVAVNFNSQFFFSDAIDGLQSQHSSNKYNEWIIHLQVGIIYHLNF